MRSDKKAKILNMLKGFGVCYVNIEFDGGGDSGQVDGITMRGLHDKDIIEEIIVPAEIQSLVGNDYPSATTLRMFLDAWAYDLIGESIEFDWINNEGGGGVIMIAVDAGTIVIEAYERISTTHDHFYDCSPSTLEVTEEDTEEDTDG